MKFYFYVFSCWVVYYVLHTLLVSDRVKTGIAARGISLNTWRILYSVFSVAGIFFIFFFTASHPQPVLLPPSAVLKMLSLSLTTYGIIIIRQAFSKTSIIAFLTREDSLSADTELVTSGLYARMRHPVYTGSLLIFTGLFFFNPKPANLIMLVVTVLYLPVGIYYEEKKLIKKYGNLYREYRQKTPALFPGLF